MLGTGGWEAVEEDVEIAVSKKRESRAVAPEAQAAIVVLAEEFEGNKVGS